MRGGEKEKIGDLTYSTANLGDAFTLIAADLKLMRREAETS